MYLIIRDLHEIDLEDNLISYIYFLAYYFLILFVTIIIVIYAWRDS